MKIIFLDIDGVLASLEYIRILSLLENPNPDIYGYSFDPRCVKNLKYIFKKIPDVKIIISSSWKSMGEKRFRDMWKYRNLPGEIIGFTPDLFKTTIDSSRGLEIQKWIDESNVIIENYIIIDDDDDMLDSQKNNFIKIDGKFGLTVDDSLRIIKLLNLKEKN